MKKSASLLIQNPKSQYLLIQRSNTCTHFVGCWEFPGGKRDGDEPPHAALVREVREEIGLDLPVPTGEPARYLTTPGGEVEYAFFKWSCPTDALAVQLSDEHSAYRWATFAEARQLKLVQIHRDFLEGDWHQQQVQAYQQELPRYTVFAKALKRVLEEACAPSLPESIVQARPKGVPSFAEKCIRKMDKYPDPVRNMTDLCGGRIIVQTLAQVQAVCRFIEKHFTILEKDDKTSSLNTDQFGYRDLHYIIAVPEGCSLAFTLEERQAIGDRRAELQVRTLVQHSWADILHDRMYKTPLRLSAETKRTGSLLAAVLEEGDRGFNRLATDLDGMIANYTAYASKDNVEKEIRVQEQLLAGESNPAQRPKLALQLARLIAACGRWQRMVELLTPHTGVAGPLRLELLSELGHALTRLHRSQPRSADYQLGQSYLQQVIQACESPDFSAIPNLRRLACVQARALARLGWAWEAIESEASQARVAYRQAVLIEPNEPYYFADMLGFELHFTPQREDFTASMRPQILAAMQACREHAAAGIELPFAYFTAGRFGLLAGQTYAALNDYARGIRHCLAEEGNVPADILDLEIAWLQRTHPGKSLTTEFQWVKDLLELAKATSPISANDEARAVNPHKISTPVLIVAGGAATLPPEQRPDIEALLCDPLSVAAGTVISGGTTSGVSGAVGAVSGRLAAQRGKQYRLLGYIPHALPHDAEKDKAYDQIIPCGANQFSPAQVLQAWKDLLAAGIAPASVTLLGFAGGPISAFEYRLALALGAHVGIVIGTGGSADAILKDALWTTLPNLLPLPADPQTLRAFLLADGWSFDPQTLEEMARAFHDNYRAGNLHKIKPDNLKRWEHLSDTYKKANREQAAYAIRILEAAGFGVRPAKGTPQILADLTLEEIELMAQLEHGRWNIERLRDGWRPGPRDDAKKKHTCLVPWSDEKTLTNEIKGYDRDSVRKFPEILAQAGLEVFRA